MRVVFARQPAPTARGSGALGPAPTAGAVHARSTPSCRAHGRPAGRRLRGSLPRPGCTCRSPSLKRLVRPSTRPARTAVWPSAGVHHRPGQGDRAALRPASDQRAHHLRRLRDDHRLGTHRQRPQTNRPRPGRLAPQRALRPRTHRRPAGGRVGHQRLRRHRPCGGGPVRRFTLAWGAEARREVPLVRDGSGSPRSSEERHRDLPERPRPARLSRHFTQYWASAPSRYGAGLTSRSPAKGRSKTTTRSRLNPTSAATEATNSIWTRRLRRP